MDVMLTSLDMRCAPANIGAFRCRAGRPTQLANPNGPRGNRNPGLDFNVDGRFPSGGPTAGQELIEGCVVNPQVDRGFALVQRAPLHPRLELL